MTIELAPNTPEDIQHLLRQIEALMPGATADDVRNYALEVVYAPLDGELKAEATPDRIITPEIVASVKNLTDGLGDDGFDEVGLTIQQALGFCYTCGNADDEINMDQDRCSNCMEDEDE